MQMLDLLSKNFTLSQNATNTTPDYFEDFQEFSPAESLMFHYKDSRPLSFLITDEMIHEYFSVVDNNDGAICLRGS